MNELEYGRLRQRLLYNSQAGDFTRTSSARQLSLLTAKTARVTMTTDLEPYTIFNDAFGTEPRESQSSTFWPFPRLPVELRTKIWTECIPTQRFVRVVLDNDSLDKFPELYTTKNELGNIISGCPYRMLAAGSAEWAPQTLIRVNHEAGSVFRRIRRVRIPLPVKGGDGSLKSLYISPENDTVWVTIQQNSRPEPLLVSFLHDLVAYDAEGIGVVHLAFGSNVNEQTMLANLDPSHLQLPARQSLTKLLSSSLQTVYPVIWPGCNGRCMLGLFSWIYGPFLHNRSLPMFSVTESYTRLERDPRPIQADLRNVAVGTDPRWQVFLWNRFKANFGVKRHIDMRYILSAGSHLPPPMGGGSAPPMGSRGLFGDLLQKYDDIWEEWTAKLGLHTGGDLLSKDEYEAQRTSLPQAAGFWSFPPEAFGEVPDINDEKYIGAEWWTHKRVKDLSEFHPEIWVFNLP